MKKLITILISVLALTSLPVMAEVRISGYGSIVAGKTFGTVDDPINIGEKRDAIFTADFYDVGQYDNEISFTPESMIAIQGVMDLSNNLSATAQLVAKGTDDFEPEFDWYYLTYQASDNLTLMAGRRNIPMYYFSEFSEVGYAYPWMRPPANLYWWQITQFNGVHAAYNFDWGDYSNTITFFYGNERSYDNKEMFFYDKLYGGDALSVDEFWEDITGLNWNISGDTFDLRFVYFQNDRNRITNHPDGTNSQSHNFSQTFIGFGGTIDFDPFTILFDWNHVEYDDELGTEFPTVLVSVVYNYDDYQPYISYSLGDNKRTKTERATNNLEEHYIASIGVRYNFLPHAAFKIQFDHFVDEGEEIGGWNFHGDSDALTVGVDFIF